MASVKKWRQYGKLIFASLVYFCQGATIAAVAPVVSIVSEEDRGIPSYFTGVIVGQDDVAIFFSSLLLFPYLINSSNYVKYFVLGSIGSILCNAVFAFTYKVDDDVVYVNMCLFIRLIEGCAFSSSWIAGLPLLMEYMPDNEAIISGITELGVVMGVVLGPSLSIGLYFLAGYAYPFIFIAGLQTIALISFFLVPIPKHESEENEDNKGAKETKPEPVKGSEAKDGDEAKADQGEPKKEVQGKEKTGDVAEVEKSGVDEFLKYYLSAPVQLLTLTMLAATSMIGYTETVLSVEFHEYMNMSDFETTVLLTVVGLAYLFTVPLATYYADRHNFIPVPIAGVALAGSLLLLGTITRSEPFEKNFEIYALLLLIAGGSAMTCITPTFTLLFFECTRRGETPVGTLISGVINAQFAFGGTIGPVIFGGILYETVEFHASCVCLGIYILLSTCFTFKYLYSTGLIRTKCDCPRHKTAPDENTNLVNKEQKSEKPEEPN